MDGKKKDIFSKEYVLVPIVAWSHWRLLLLCGRDEGGGPSTMYLLDSLRSMNLDIEHDIRNFVMDMLIEAGMKMGRCRMDKIPLRQPKFNESWFTISDFNNFKDALLQSKTVEVGELETLEEVLTDKDNEIHRQTVLEDESNENEKEQTLDEFKDSDDTMSNSEVMIF